LERAAIRVFPSIAVIPAGVISVGVVIPVLIPVLIPAGVIPVFVVIPVVIPVFVVIPVDVIPADWEPIPSGGGFSSVVTSKLLSSESISRRRAVEREKGNKGWEKEKRKEKKERTKERKKR